MTFKTEHICNRRLFSFVLISMKACSRWCTSYLFTIPVLKFERVITKTSLFKYTKKFYHPKKWKFSDKNFFFFLDISAQNIDGLGGSDAPSGWRPGGRRFNPRRGRQHSFVEIDREIFSTVILSLPLIQEGQLSVSGERMCTILVNRLED